MTEFISAFHRAEQPARASKWRRWLAHPLRYPAVLLFNKAVYPWLKKGINVRVRLFTGDLFTTILPAGTDLLLHGIKSHDSEIRLTAFLLQHLESGDTFVDVGAHYGYYTLIAARLVGASGKVMAFEAAPDSLSLLRENAGSIPQVKIMASAVSDSTGEITFWTYPGPQAEWNTTATPEDYPGVRAVPIRVPCITLDEALSGLGADDLLVKMDVEGGEPAVLRGMTNLLRSKPVTLVMEYLLADQPDNPHDVAVADLRRLGYAAYAIRPDGTVEPVADVRRHMLRHRLSSDNLVFRHPEIR